jgi:hypothetical protein
MCNGVWQVNETFRGQMEMVERTRPMELLNMVV